MDPRLTLRFNLVPDGHWPSPHTLHLRNQYAVSDEAVEKLGILFSEQLLLAALDLIDRDCGKREQPVPASLLSPSGNEK